MLINVDQLWKPACNPPQKSGFYLCMAIGNEGDTGKVISYYEESKGYWSNSNNDVITHWMPLPSAPGNSLMMEIPSEATLQLYGSDSELACIKVEPREGQSGAAIAVLIRTDLSVRLTSIANKDGLPPEPDDWVDDEVFVSLQAYESSRPYGQWGRLQLLSFVEAEYNLERENKC